MYHRILVPLENTRTDRVILPHLRALARHCGASIVLIHVADGFAARNIQQLDLRESEEMRRDRQYLDAVSAELVAEGFECEAVLACGNPADEISSAAVREGADLIAMATHGHKLVGDLFLGSTIDRVRHNTSVPILVVRAGSATAAPLPHS